MDRRELRQRLFDGICIPAHPLALTAERKLDERRQRGLTRYYLAAGAGGIAIGVHTTQFAVRDPAHGLHEPLLALTAEEIGAFERRTGARILKVAGVIGPTRQALREAELAARHGYDAALLGLGWAKDRPVEEILRHCRDVAEVMPLFGFYLQPAAGGVLLPPAFWVRFLEIENVVAVKVAPFNRYHTLDVLRPLAESGRQDEVALYTGNDDSIVVDLVTPFAFEAGGRRVEVRFRGGLLGARLVTAQTGPEGETVNAVWNPLVLLVTIIGRSSACTFSGVRQRQTMPLHSRMRSAICGTVRDCAGKMRSTSFSRSKASATCCRRPSPGRSRSCRPTGRGGCGSAPTAGA